jgi:CheY-like chemotaxis protein
MVAELIRDVTDRKNLEREMLKAQKLTSLGVLAGGIAHDFNNLLTVILGNLSLVEALSNPDNKILSRLTEAINACRRAGDLTQQLLTFARGGAPVKRTTDVGKLVRDSAQFSLSGSNVRSEMTIPESLWQVEADEGQISQVINNMVLNAVQAMPHGGGIRILCRNAVVGEGSAPAPGDYVLISIADEGTGISPEHLDKIFDPYFTTKKNGSGIGLTTAYSIVTKHGGYIDVNSKLGAGTTFTIMLPASGNRNIPGIGIEKEDLTGSERILVMDDDLFIRDVAGEMLEHFGYRVAFCSQGEEAVELYQSELPGEDPFSAILMDLTIPGGMGGREAMKRLLEIDPNAKGIVSSGYSNDPVLANYREYGFCGAVRKPYNVEELGTTLRRVLGKNKRSDDIDV